MATAQDLMGLGVAPLLAEKLGDTPVRVSAAGTTIGDAAVISGNAKIAFIAAGTSAAVLRSPASADGPLLGQQIEVSNITGATVILYVRNATIYFIGVSVSGSTGVSIGIGQTAYMRPLTASTWVGSKSLVSA